MSLLVIGTVAFDAIETPFGKTDKIVGGAATFISMAASYFTKNINLVSVVGDDFPTESIEMLHRQRRVALQQHRRLFARPFKQRRILRQIGKAQHLVA